jgi:hypothetical protein
MRLRRSGLMTFAVPGVLYNTPSISSAIRRNWRTSGPMTRNAMGAVTPGPFSIP